jgi:FMN-dependent NADH-azoreductase
MTTILHLASSSNLHGSFSRKIGTAVMEALAQHHPDVHIVTRDLVTNPVPHVSPELLAAMFAKDPQAPALALSNQLTEQLMASDLLVVEAPMYNFGIPSALKAWIDHVLRAGMTFHYTANGPEGLLKNKKAILVIARGGIYTTGPAAAMDHQESYLRAILGFIGIGPIETVYIEGTALGEAQVNDAMAKAKTRVDEIAKAA